MMTRGGHLVQRLHNSQDVLCPLNGPQMGRNINDGSLGWKNWWSISSRYVVVMCRWYGLTLFLVWPGTGQVYLVAGDGARCDISSTSPRLFDLEDFPSR